MAPGPSTSLRVELCSPLDLIPSQLSRWRSLQRENSALRNPFLSTEFAIAVARVKPGARVAILVDGDREAAFFPHERSRLGVGRPIGAGVSDAQAIIAPEDLNCDPIQLMDMCQLDVLTLDHLVAPAPSLSRYVHHSEPSPVMDLGGGFDVYLDRLRERDGSVRRIRQRQRRLEKDYRDVQFVMSPGNAQALASLRQWKSAQYRRTSRSDRFAKPWITKLVEAIISADTPTFSGATAVLSAEGRPIAVNLALRSADTAAGWFTAYDPDFARYSPGLTLQLLMAENLAQTGVTLFDLGKGFNEQKERLKTGDGVVSEAQIIRRTPRAAIFLLAHEPPRRIERFILDRPGLRRAASRSLKWLGSVRPGTAA
jgi:CelD/BcsL family acetyltransferase involved in cellulose biosynthesis